MIQRFLAVHCDGVLFEGDGVAALECVCRLLRRDSRELHLVVLHAVQMMMVMMVGVSDSLALGIGELLSANFLVSLRVERRSCRLNVAMLVILVIAG